ncbi:MAG: DNA primase [Candidatus Moraniibacteriota bacterium]
MGQEVEIIKSKLNVVDLIGEYVRLQKAGNNWKACCPFHNEKTPSFTVSEEKQMWHCFGCNKGGDIFGFLMEIEGLNFREALENLAQRAGVELPKYRGGENFFTPEEKSKVGEILEWATLFYEKQLWQGLGKGAILKYLKERGLAEETIKDFRLGYAPPGWRNLLTFLTNKGYESKDILRAGLIIEKEGGRGRADDFYDRFRDRIMFPIANTTGKIIGYSARINPGGDESQAKYINTPETEVYHKSGVLYGIEKAKMKAREDNWILLVEGNMDVIASYQAGIKNTVAVSGTALTEDQLNIIRRYTKNIKMFFDMDEAGQTAARRSAQLAFEKDLNVFIVSIDEGKDAADIAKENIDKFRQAIEGAVPAMGYFIEKSILGKDKRDIQDKKKIIEELSGLINSFSNKVEKEYWLKKISGQLDISEKALAEEFEKNNNRQWSSENRSVSGKGEEPVEYKYDKIKDIQIQILGAFISEDSFWREGVAKYSQAIEDNFDNKKIVEILINRGKETDFNFEKLLDIIEDANWKNFLRELYFKNCEKDQNLNSLKEKWLAVDQYFLALKKELLKNRNAELIEKIRKAEDSRDKEAVKEITRQLVELNKVE